MSLPCSVEIMKDLCFEFFKLLGIIDHSRISVIILLHDLYGGIRLEGYGTNYIRVPLQVNNGSN